MRLLTLLTLLTVLTGCVSFNVGYDVATGRVEAGVKYVPKAAGGKEVIPLE